MSSRTIIARWAGLAGMGDDDDYDYDDDDDDDDKYGSGYDG
jgi:hypothetical protein